MRGGEWSLVIFTLLTQLAIGSFLVITAVKAIYISKPDGLTGREIIPNVLLAVVVVLVLSILASFLHLGKPKNATFSVAHFSGSWLSREIAFLLLFTFLTSVSFVLQLEAGKSIVLLDVITGLVGIAAILSMARVYMLETVPVWNSPVTPIQFLCTSIILGGFAITLLFAKFGVGITKILLPVLIFLLSVHFITFLIHLRVLPGAGLAGAESYRLLTEGHIVLLILRPFLLLVSIIIACILFFAMKNTSSSYILSLLYFIVFVSEIIGRYLFYASYSRVGV